MELEHSQLDLTNASEIPVFKGTEYEEHVNAWMEIDERVQDCYWKLGAVAASLVNKYGEDVKGKFASDVGSSARRIREYAETYRRWESGDRSPLLSFKHHTLAARSKDPQKAIETAEDEKLSTRELEEVVKAEKPKGSAKYKSKKPPEVEDVEEDSQDEEWVLCPCCEGHSSVPKRSSKSIAKAIKGLTIFGKGR